MGNPRKFPVTGFTLPGLELAKIYRLTNRVSPSIYLDTKSDNSVTENFYSENTSFDE
jgi:hypothetical protein